MVEEGLPERPCHWYDDEQPEYFCVEIATHVGSIDPIHPYARMFLCAEHATKCFGVRTVEEFWVQVFEYELSL